MRFLRKVSYTLRSHEDARSSTSESDRSCRSSSSATLAAADSASSSVQPLAMVLARNACMRSFSLSSAAGLNVWFTDHAPGKVDRDLRFNFAFFADTIEAFDGH